MNSRKPDKILIIKLWAIGEVALATPCIAGLASAFPGAEISFLVGRRAMDIVSANRAISRVFPVDEDIFLRPSPARLLSLIKRLRREKFDLAVTLHHAAHFSFFAVLIGARQRIGLRRPGSLSFNTADIVSDGATGPKIFDYLNVLKLLPVPVAPQDARISVETDESDAMRVDALMKEGGLRDKRFVVLSCTGGENPAASRMRSNVPNKVWPPDYYRRLCDLILDGSEYKVAVVGGEGEVRRAASIAGEGRPRAVDLTGRMNLREVRILAEKALLSVTNDSGPLHVLSAAPSPVIAIFGPTDPSLICAPSGNIHIMREEMECSPCYDGKTFPNMVRECGYASCMRAVTPEKVFKKICEIAEKGGKS
ncbi:MAG: glycosyltransferase family 9 protein [Candidatus Omnitrophota bacterium]